MTGSSSFRTHTGGGSSCYREVPLGMPEEQSSTVMIESVLSELAFEVQATEARCAKEEEGSSPTLCKDDNEENNIEDKDQITDTTYQQIEA